eukprot:974720-Alexandrium_andersonii.AAC.1
MGRGPSTPNAPNGPLRGSESAQVGDAPFGRSKRKRRRASRGASCTWLCGKGASDFRRFGAARRA